MKILHILGCRSLPASPDDESTSGVVRAALEFARAQVRLGHKAWIAVTGNASWSSTWNGVRLVGLSTVPWAQVRLNGRVLDVRQHIPYVLFTWLHPFDIVHGHLYSYMRFLRAAGYIAHFHSDPFYRGHNNEGYDLKPTDLVHIAEHTDAQIAASQFIRDDLQRVFSHKGNTHLVRYGINAELFDPEKWQDEGLNMRREWGVPEKGIVILFAGAILPEKGVIHLARAFSRLAAQNCKVHLVVAGTSSLWGSKILESASGDSYEEQVRKSFSREVAAQRVHFLDKVASSKMPAVYAACDILVTPSVWKEAFGLVALEALASARPVIASRVGGLVEFVNEANGLLVSPGDESELEHAMRTLMENRDLRLQLGHQGRVDSLSYSWDLAARQLDSIYTDILARKVKS